MLLMLYILPAENVLFMHGFVSAHTPTRVHRERLRRLEIHCLRPTVLSDGSGLKLLVFRAGFFALYANLHASSRFLQALLTP